MDPPPSRNRVKKVINIFVYTSFLWSFLFCSMFPFCSIQCFSLHFFSVVFTILFYISFHTRCFSLHLLSAVLIASLSFLQNSTLSLLFNRIYSFSLHFHFFSAEFTLSLYTFNSFQHNSLFLFTLSLIFSRIHSFSLHFHLFSTEFTLSLYTFTSFLQNLLFLLTLSLLFSRIYSFSLHFHFFSAEFTLSLYTFTSFLHNFLFLFILSLLFCRIYSYSLHFHFFSAEFTLFLYTSFLRFLLFRFPPASARLRWYCKECIVAS